MGKNYDYNIGLDIGTNSVGYAVTDLNGTLLKFKKKNMWGSRLFSEGQSAQATRVFRATRRRYDRRRNRIKYLQSFLADDVAAVDEAFFVRLSQSSLWQEDRDQKTEGFYNLFNGSDFNDKDYFKKFPTVYHLRKHLMQSNEKQDIRLVYLALHHILKYRGNFLYEGQENISAQNSQMDIAISAMLEALEDIIEDYKADAAVINEIVDILNNERSKKADKKKDIIKALAFDKEDKQKATHVANAIIGYKADFTLIFSLESEEKISIALSSEEAESKLEGLLDENQMRAFEAFQNVYSAFILTEILKGENVTSLSDAMINKYEKHKKDLASLKSIYKKHLSKDEYNEMFRGVNADEKKKANSYSAYILGETFCPQEELYKKIKSKLQTLKEVLPSTVKVINKILDDIEEKNFLPKIHSKDNGAIPYQLHLEELRAIVERQAGFYPGLAENKEKLEAVLKFRITYYVGPLNEKEVPEDGRQFAWMKRKVDGVKIHPWNFEEVVDVDETAERFIKRMTNKCTYLPLEDVLPKCSLLYAEYEVMSEIKQIRVDNEFLPISIQRALFEQVFKKYKTVNENTLRRWLRQEQRYAAIGKITGFQKEAAFATSYKAYIDFSKIFGLVSTENSEDIEKMILWITLFEDKKILKRKIKQEMPWVTQTQRESIAKLNYTGWGRLSEKLLDGIKAKDNFGKEKTIIETMRTVGKNFMQIINDKELGFKELIAKEAKPEKLESITAEVIDQLAGSKAIKRGIKQCADVVAEIVKIMGKEPKGIFIEFAREEGAKRRTTSRQSKLEKIYKEINATDDYKDILAQLKEYGEKLDDRMVYLYFLQNGKCLYSGRPLNLAALAQTCQIDHIIPQSYIKDDSFDNLALVLSGMNQEKGDDLLIKADIRRNQQYFWEALNRSGLMSDSKLRRLKKSEFYEDDYKHFINRQLVETRQITKHVANLFGALYENTKVNQVKADLVSNLRMQYGLYKSRNINDHHHAHDAYLAAVVGNYVNICHPYLSDDFDYFAINRFVQKNENAGRTKYGYIVGAFTKNHVNKATGEVWVGKDQLAKVRKSLNYKDCFISKKTEEDSGEFFNQTKYSKTGDTKSLLIPLKKNLPVSKYGGYSRPNEAYSVIIEYDGKKGREKKLIGLPIYILSLAKTQPHAIENYFEEAGFLNVKVAPYKIKKYQHITYEGHEFYLSSSTEIHNARQLLLTPAHNETVFKMNHPAFKDILKTKALDALFDYLLEKIDRFYKCYINHYKKMNEARDDFFSREKEEKTEIINQMLVMLQANPTTGNFKKFKFANLRSESTGRLNNKKNLKVDRISLHFTSVTGMFVSTLHGKDIEF